MLYGKRGSPFSFLIIIFCTAVFLCGCFLVSFERFSAQILTDYENGIFYIGENLNILFSETVNQQSAEKCITLKKDGSSVSTDFTWKENTVELSPCEGWKKGYFYSAEISGSIETSDGRFYSVSESREFFSGSLDERLCILDKPDCDFKARDDQMVFRFSKSVNETSFLDCFSLSPYTEYKIEFLEEDKTVLVTPVSVWPLNTSITWTLNDALKAKDNYCLGFSFSGSVNTVICNELPEVSFICPAVKYADSWLLLKNQSLDSLSDSSPVAFMFSELMDYESVKSSITFLPSISGSLYPVPDEYSTESYDKAKLFVYVPDKNYLPETEYCIKISRSACSVSGLKLYENYKTYFTSASKYLTIEKLVLNGKTVSMDCDSNEKGKPGSDTIENISDEYDGTLYAQIYFSTVIDSDCRNAAADALSCFLIFPSTASSPVLRSVWWNTEGSVLNAEWDGLSVSDRELPLYELTVSGGLGGVTNINGEYMEDDVCINFYLE